MLNKKELLIVNEVVKGFDNTCYVVSNDKEIIIKSEGLTDETFTNRNSFLNELIATLKLDTLPDNEILRQKEAAEHMNILNVLLTGEKIKVTNNEFNQICKDLASKYYKNFSLYDALTELYDIIPFNINTDNEELKRIINILCNEEEQTENKIKYIGMGSGSDIYTAKELLNMNFIFDEYYSKSMYNDNLKLLIDYCEGDIYFTLCSNKESYQAEKERTIKFYNENY